MEHAHKYEKRGVLFMSMVFVLVILGLKLPIYRRVWKNIYFLNEYHGDKPQIHYKPFQNKLGSILFF